MVPHVECDACVEGFLLHAAGAWPPGVPFCPEHGFEDASRGGEGPVSSRAVPQIVLQRWRIRAFGKAFGWLMPVVAVVTVLIGVARFVVLHPRTSLALALLAGLGWLLVAHRVLTISVGVTLLEVGHLWWWLHRASFRRWIGLPALGVWRTVFVYRRRWAAAMLTCELARKHPEAGWQVPGLGRVRCLEGGVDLVRARALLGQRGSDWEDAIGMLGHALGATDARVHRGDDRRLTLELRRGKRGRSWHRSGVLELPPVPE
jgi:hypothetical protein